MGTIPTKYLNFAKQLNEKYMYMHNFLRIPLLVGLLSSVCTIAFAQNTVIVTKCVNLSPSFSTSSTGLAGTFVGQNVTMVSGVDFPAGYVISDMYVQVNWSKTQGSCAAPTGGAVDLAEVGFRLSAPAPALPASMTLAASNAVAPFMVPPTTSSWSGTTQQLNITTTFHDGAPSLLPAALPVSDTFATNGNVTLAMTGGATDWLGDSPAGNWSLLAVDDPSANPAVLCVHSYCITFILCSPTSLNADCKANTTLSVGPGGTAFPDFATLNLNSDTSCWLKSMTFTSVPAAPFTCAHVGSTIPITMTLTDRLNVTDVCVSNVTIVDNVAPVIICDPYTVYLNAAGTFTFVAADSIVASDNCGIQAGSHRINGSPTRTFTCVNAGTAPTFTLSVQDVNGNTSNCSAQIFILDTIPPTANCHATRTFYLGASGTVIVGAAQIDNGSTEVCPPIVNRTINGASSHTYTCADIGANTATLEVFDIFGNSSTCTSTVTILDTVRPTANCATISANLDAAGNVTVAATALNNASTDNCTVASFNVGGSANVSFDCTDVGTPQTVVLTVVDNSGNTRNCNATVNVMDVTPPSALCQNATMYLNGAGTVTVNPSDVNAGSSDVCSGTTLTYLVNGGASASLNCTHLGAAQNMTLTATDQSGNSSTCVGTVTVFDTVSPVAVCQPITVQLSAAGTVSVTGTQIDGGSTDNCGITTRLINNLAAVSFNCSHVAAVQNVTLRVQDASGNFKECSAAVTVRDTVDPTATCNNLTVSLNALGTVNVIPSSVVTTSDACGIASSTINGGASATYTCANLGTNTATLLVTDVNGNTRTCTSTITVQDVTNPIAVCQNRTVYLNPTSVTVTAAQINNGSTDNCAVSTLLINGAASVNYTCANLGANTATLTVRDASNNSSTCTSTITVLDTVRPNALCLGAISVSLDATGTVAVLPSAINNTSTDNCAVSTLLINGAASATYNCSHVTTSPNIATLTVSDASGNSNTCTTQINVQDGVAPDANCVNGTFYVNASGQAVVNATDIGNTSTDNCPPPSLTINGFVATSQTYTCANLGSNTVTIVAQDASGNSDVCTATVTVLDTIDPVANCNATINAYIGAGGTVAVAATQVNNASTDNCGVSSLNLSGSASQTYTCADIGNNPEILNVTDASGNVASCNTTVIVADTTRPTATCQNRTVTLGPLGTGNVTASQVNLSSSDNCNTISLFLNAIGNTQVNYNCTNVGSNTVTLIVRDNSGNQRTCTSTITVVDNTAPNTVCQSGVNIYLNGTGNATVGTGQINSGTSDNCGIATLSVSPSSFNCSNVGPQTVTLTATDINGNTSSCNTTVTVQDTVRPVMGCQNQTLTLSGAGTASLLATQINLGSTDNCGAVSLAISDGGAFAPSLNFNCSDIGTQTITLQGTDVNGNTRTCNATLTVLDVAAPTANCRNLTVNIGAGGTVTVLGTDLNSTTTPSSDNCSPLSFFINTVGNTDTVFSCAQIGNRNLTLIVQDPAGNQATCLSTVTVQDVTAPIAACQSGVSLFLNSLGTVSVTTTQINNSSSDNCGIATMTVSPTSFNCSQVGTQTVTLTVTDVNGNTATCASSVLVRDTVAPTMVCNNTTLSLSAVGGTVTLVPADIGSGSTDACGISTRLIREGGSGPFLSSILYNCAQVGPHTVTFQATDVNGNVGTCNATVTIQDITNPTALCQNIVTNLNAGGTSTVLATQLNNNSTDNCVGGLTFSINNVGNTDTVFTCAQVGNQNLTLIVRDASGNQSTCTATVTVVDGITPVAACQNATVYLGAAGTVTVLPANINNGSSDNCSSLSMTVTPNLFDCGNVGGVNNVVLTVSDASGNNSSCNALVDVQDTLAPNMVCTPDTVFLSSVGFANEPASGIDGGTTDNCGISSLLIRRSGSSTYSSNAVFTCADLGLQAATLQATDLYSNVDSCQTTVLVRDTVKPTVVCNTPITLDLTAAGTLTLPASTFDGGSSDNCGTLSFLINNQPNITFTCSNISATQFLTLRATDGSGNFRTCTVQATIRDVTAPNAICKATHSVNLGFATGTATVNAITLNNGSTDACGPLSFLINGQPSFTYNCSHLGVNTAILTVLDGSGNSDSCTTQVTVNDIHAPNPNCLTNVTLPLDATGLGAFVVANVNSGSTDNCGVVSFVQTSTGFSTVNYTCANLGNNVLNVTMADAAGNTATCVTVVQVIDNLAPIPDCFNNPVQVFLNSSGTVSVPAIALDSNSTDNCAITTRLINGAASQQYTCANIGISNATLTVRDASNNFATCVAQVQVRDTLDPTALCKNISVNLNAAGFVVVAASAINNLSTDNCGTITLLINGTATDTFTCANVGTNVALLTVTDGSGNVSTCNSQVTVQDVNPPTVTCTNPTVFLDVNGQASVSGPGISSSADNCSIVTWLINSQPSQAYNCSHVGSFQPAVISVTDVGGNTTSCNSFITVVDTISPIAICNNITVQLDVAGNATVTPANLALPSSYDNCGISSMTIGGQASVNFTCADVGNQSVLVTVTDSSNNTQTCVAVVTVEDNIAPVANCFSPVPVQLGSNGTVIVNAASINNNSTDACAPLSFFFINGQMADTFNCSNVGNNPILLIVEDATGNQSFCSSVLQISDLTPPVANCQPVTAYLNNGGTVTVQDLVLDAPAPNNSTDNCQIFNFHIDVIGNSSNTYNCSSVGIDTVLFIVQDPYNNYDTCVTTITVVDTVPPIVSATNAAFNLSNTGPFQLQPSQVNATANDACGIDTIFLTPDTITCNDEGILAVVVTAVDVNGNMATDTSFVTITIENPTPTTDIPLGSFVCEGTNVSLFANPPAGSYTYQWTGPAGSGFSSTSQDPVITPAEAINDGWYYLQITPISGAGCPGLDSVEVFVNIVAPPILAANAPICAGDTAMLTITNANTYVGANITYDWSFNGVPFSPANDTTFFNIPTSSAAAMGDYTVVVNVDGCIDSSASPFFLNINPLPAQPQPYADTLCQGEDLTLLANPPAGNFTFSWSGPNGFTSVTENPVLNSISLADEGLYVLVITDDSTCVSSDTVQVLVKTVPTMPSINYNDPICVGEVLELFDTTSYTFPPDYVWTLPNNTSTITSVPTLLLPNGLPGTYGVYALYGAIANGCVSDTNFVTVVYEPVPVAEPDRDSVPFRDSITIDVLANDSIGAYVISIVDTSENHTVTINSDGTLNYYPGYSFFGLDTFYYSICHATCPGSCDTAMVVVEVTTDFECFIPDAISPNGDGINDVWRISCVHDYPNAELRLFSRWGNLVYEGAFSGFNAQFNGRDLPDGSYFYVLKLNDTTHVPKDRYTGYLIINR